MTSSSSTQNLDRTLVHGIAWTGGIRWVTQMLSWSATFVVARLLTPTDYGLVGMAMIYVGLAQIVSEGGVAAAIVQQRELGENEVAQLNGLAAMIGVVLFVITLALAAPISWFFEEPQVYPVMLVLSSVFLIRGVQVVPRALLARDLNFRQLAWVDGLELFSLMIVTVVLALLHFKYWALAIGGVVSSVFTTFLALRWRPHRLAIPRTIDAIRHPVDFAWQVVTSQVAWYAYSNADFAVVGRVLGKAALGAYQFAWTIASIPVDRVSGMVSRVTPAFFAAVQHDPPALRRYLLNLTEGLAIITLPACIGLAVVAPEFVQVALGPNWSGAIVPLRLLSMYAAFRSIITPAPQILIATGHSRQSMYFSLLAVVILPPAFYIGTRWGAPGVAMVWLLVYPIIAIGLFLRYAFRIIGMTAREYIAALLPAAGATAAMAVVVLTVRAFLPPLWTPLERLLAQVLVGAAVYCVIVYTIHGERLRAVHALLRGRNGNAQQGEMVFDTGAHAGADRLLLITYHFPPDQSVGALRWRRLAKHAAERGWGVDVITLHPSSLAKQDPAAMADLPPGVRVYGVMSSPPPFERPVAQAWELWQRFRNRGARVEPDAAPLGRAESRAMREVRWWPRDMRDLRRAYYATVEHLRYSRWGRQAARVALKVYNPNFHRAVITCGPPHPVHRAGVIVARKTHLPLVVDLRDPWSLVQRLPEHLASWVGLALARREEREAVSQSALVVANTQPFRNAMRQAYPGAMNRIIAVPNGYDEDPVPASQPARRFSMVYTGTVYLDRDPQGLFRGAARVIRDLDLTPADFGIDIMGDAQAYNGVPLAQIARQEGIADYVTVLPRGPRAEALELMARAAMLVVLPQDSDMAIPAKLFDYARFDAWVLVLAERGSATDLLLQNTPADLVRPGDIDRLTETLRKRYLQHVRGERGTRLASEERLSRRRQATVLFDSLEAIVGAPRRPQPEKVAAVPVLTKVGA